MTKLKFPGGFHSSPKTIFEKLGEIGIRVEKSLQHYPWLIVYDMEALLLRSDTEDQSIWKTEHRPVSVCINSVVSERIQIYQRYRNPGGNAYSMN